MFWTHNPNPQPQSRSPVMGERLFLMSIKHRFDSNIRSFAIHANGATLRQAEEQTYLLSSELAKTIRCGAETLEIWDVHFQVDTGFERALEEMLDETISSFTT